MRFFKQQLLILLLISCNLNSENEEEEFYFYEPIIGEAYQVTTDYEHRVDFEYQIRKDLLVETEDSKGYIYRLEIPAFALTPGSVYNFNGYIAPLTGIQNLPANSSFLFGIEIEPSGMNFSKPVKITVDLPADFDTQGMWGFYNEGEWGTAYMEPVMIKRLPGKTEAIFSISHFSAYGAMGGGAQDFDCPDPRSAQYCNDLNEIIACKLKHYEVGLNGELSQEDKNEVNNILRKYMETQLRYLEEEVKDYYDMFQFQSDLKEYLCWEAKTQLFNGNPEAVFGDLYARAEKYIIMGFNEVISDLEETCLADRLDQNCVFGNAWGTTQSYLQAMVIAQKLGIDQQMPVSNIFEFCDGALNELLRDFTMVDPGSMTEYPYHGQGGIDIDWKSYIIEFSDPDDVFLFEYYMTNPLDSVAGLNEGEIQWIETTTGTNAGAFIYSNGILSLNKSQEYVSDVLSCNSREETCTGAFNQVYALTRDGCEIAWASVRWEYSY